MIRVFITNAAARAVSFEERVFMCVFYRKLVVIDPYCHNTARAMPVAKTWIVTCCPGGREATALRFQALRKPGAAIVAARSTHASHPWRLRTKLRVLYAPENK